MKVHITLCIIAVIAMIVLTKMTYGQEFNPKYECEVKTVHKTLEDGSIWVVCPATGKKLYQTFSPDGMGPHDCKEVDGKFVCDYSWPNEQEEPKK